MVLKQEHRLTPVSELKKHPQNPRRGDVPAIKASIRRNGFFGEVIAQKSTGYILAGNHRFDAAIESGAKEIPVCWVDCDERIAIKILLADNRTADLGHYNDALLVEALSKLDQTGAALDGTGYTNDDYAALVDSLNSSNIEIEPDKIRPPKVQGDKVKVLLGEFVGFATRESYERLLAQVPDLNDKSAVRQFLRRKVGLP